MRTAPDNSRGRLITLEGGEGAGKSTQIRRLAESLQNEGYRVCTTREPGGTRLGEAVRAVLMADHGMPMPAMSELLLVFAARAAHLAQVIEPALRAGEIVICDRFTDSSFAYQGAAGALGCEAVGQLETLVQGSLRPDGVIVLDLPVAQGVLRTRSRAKNNRFDHEQSSFHEIVRQCYLERANAVPARYAVVDATADIDSVANDVARAARRWL